MVVQQQQEQPRRRRRQRRSTTTATTITTTSSVSSLLLYLMLLSRVSFAYCSANRNSAAAGVGASFSSSSFGLHSAKTGDSVTIELPRRFQQLRGGSSSTPFWGSGRRPHTPSSSKSPFSSTDSRQTSDKDKAATKEMLDAFLTRDSRNTFISTF